MRILVYGAGVIGSLYALLLYKKGADVTLYARGKRLAALQKNGLRYRKGKEIKTLRIPVISVLEDKDRYDIILLAVRENQLHAALEELSRNVTPIIVTMVNSTEEKRVWEDICGKGRILQAFPGAGGGFEEDVLDAALTPGIIQKTTFGRCGGREEKIVDAFRRAGIPCAVTEDMHTWQLCHLSLVVPLGDVYYRAEDPKHAGSKWLLMVECARKIRENLDRIYALGMDILPGKLNAIRILPIPLTALALKMVFQSSFGDRFMYRHAMKAPDEMRSLHDALYRCLLDMEKEKGRKEGQGK